MSKDYFAELYVAGVLARSGWNVYFPHRDQGFDFIISKPIGDEIVTRPVQVKGKYPEPDKTDKPGYGYIGELTQKHPEMVLAIPYFSTSSAECPPLFIAFMPLAQIKKHSRGVRCQPATFRDGQARPRRDFAQFLGSDGLQLLESEAWNETAVAGSQ